MGHVFQVGVKERNEAAASHAANADEKYATHPHRIAIRIFGCCQDRFVAKPTIHFYWNGSEVDAGLCAQMRARPRVFVLVVQSADKPLWFLLICLGRLVLPPGSVVLFLAHAAPSHGPQFEFFTLHSRRALSAWSWRSCLGWLVLFLRWVVFSLVHVAILVAVCGFWRSGVLGCEIILFSPTRTWLRNADQ